MLTEVRSATDADLPYIEALRRRNGDALGFIPLERYAAIVERRLSAGRARWRYEHVWVAQDNGDLTGYLYGAFPSRHRLATVWQVCIQDDARRFHRALALLAACESEACRFGARAIRADVAADLEANLFWRAAGYEIKGSRASTFLARNRSGCGRLLLSYEKPLSENTIEPPLFAVAST